MDRTELKAIVEALIFASDTPLTPERIRETVETSRDEDIARAVEELNQDYAASGRVFVVRQVAGGYQVATRPEYGNWIKKLFLGRHKTRLSQAALETLAIVAFKQPISRVDIAQIRGVNSDGVIGTLLERRLITISGRSEGVGRPLLYSTTPEFLKYFGINDISELPKPREIEELIGKEGMPEEVLQALSADKQLRLPINLDPEAPEEPAAESDSFAIPAVVAEMPAVEPAPAQPVAPSPSEATEEDGPAAGSEPRSEAAAPVPEFEPESAAATEAPDLPPDEQQITPLTPAEAPVTSPGEEGVASPDPFGETAAGNDAADHERGELELRDGGALDAPMTAALNEEGDTQVRLVAPRDLAPVATPMPPPESVEGRPAHATGVTRRSRRKTKNQTGRSDGASASDYPTAAEASPGTENAIETGPASAQTVAFDRNASPETEFAPASDSPAATFEEASVLPDESHAAAVDPVLFAAVHSTAISEPLKGDEVNAAVSAQPAHTDARTGAEAEPEVCAPAYSAGQGVSLPETLPFATPVFDESDRDGATAQPWQAGAAAGMAASPELDAIAINTGETEAAPVAPAILPAGADGQDPGSFPPAGDEAPPMPEAEHLDSDVDHTDAAELPPGALLQVERVEFREQDHAAAPPPVATILGATAAEVMPARDDGARHGAAEYSSQVPGVPIAVSVGESATASPHLEPVPAEGRGETLRTGWVERETPRSESTAEEGLDFNLRAPSLNVAEAAAREAGFPTDRDAGAAPSPADSRGLTILWRRAVGWFKLKFQQLLGRRG